MYWIPIIFIIGEIFLINKLDMFVRLSACNELLKKYDSINKKFKPKPEAFRTGAVWKRRSLQMEADALGNPLKSYIKSEFKGTEASITIMMIVIMLEYIYFIIGIFYSIWMISVFFIFTSILSLIISKLKKPDSDEIKTMKLVKSAKLSNFETSDIKFQRFLKLNELNNKDVKTNIWITYLYSFVKIITFLSIIILHYHYKIL